LVLEQLSRSWTFKRYCRNSNLKSEKFSFRLRRLATSSAVEHRHPVCGEGGRLAWEADRQDARVPHSRDGRAPFSYEDRRDR
jgi:hypothetical protein